MFSNDSAGYDDDISDDEIDRRLATAGLIPSPASSGNPLASLATPPASTGKDYTGVLGAGGAAGSRSPALIQALDPVGAAQQVAQQGAKQAAADAEQDNAAAAAAGQASQAQSDDDYQRRKNALGLA